MQKKTKTLKTFATGYLLIVLFLFHRENIISFFDKSLPSTRAVV